MICIDEDKFYERMSFIGRAFGYFCKFAFFALIPFGIYNLIIVGDEIMGIISIVFGGIISFLFIPIMNYSTVLHDINKTFKIFSWCKK